MDWPVILLWSGWFAGWGGYCTARVWVAPTAPTRTLFAVGMVTNGLGLLMMCSLAAMKLAGEG